MNKRVNKLGGAVDHDALGVQAADGALDAVDGETAPRGGFWIASYAGGSWPSMARDRGTRWRWRILLCFTYAVTEYKLFLNLLYWLSII